MDAFALRDRLIDEYKQYVGGFISIKEPRAKEYVDDLFAKGYLWPEPLVQLNPAFQQGPTIDQLVAQGTLHSECATIFRRRDEPQTSGRPMTLHWHQAEALEQSLEWGYSAGTVSCASPATPARRMASVAEPAPPIPRISRSPTL